MSETHVLIIEDDGIIAESIREIIGDAGYRSTIAATGADAIRLTQELNPELILMDIRLKGLLSGIEAAVEIRKTSEVPLIYLTAYSDDALLQQAKQTRPHAYLLKPFHARELIATMEMVLHRYLTDQELHNVNQEIDQRLKNRLAVIVEKAEQALAEQILRDGAPSPNAAVTRQQLSKTENRVADLILKGLTTKEIATTLKVATSTIDTHRNNIRKKLGIQDRMIKISDIL